MKLLLLTLRKWWCLLWHAKHRDQYDMGYSVWFCRCRKCGQHYTTRRT